MIAATLLAAALAAGSDAPPIRVDDVSIPSVAITARASELRARGVRVEDKQLVQGLVDETLLSLDATRSGLAAKPEVRALVTAEQTRFLAKVLLDREVAKGIQPPEGYLRELYHSNSDFVRLKLVVVASEAEAKAVRDRLDKGGEIELEAVRSLDPVSSAKRGDTGDMARAQFPTALADLLFAAKPGALVGPVQWGPGWAVARVVSRAIGDEAGFKAKRGSIETHARNLLTSQAKSHFLKAIREREKIAVDEKFLDGLRDRIDPTPTEAAHVLATIRGVPFRYADAVPAIRQVASGEASMHRSGPAIKKQIVSKTVDEWVLAALARDRGMDKAPDLAPLLARAEHQALARGAIDRILAALPARAAQKDAQRAVDDRLAVLRKKAVITVDNAKALAAIKAAP